MCVSHLRPPPSHGHGRPAPPYPSAPPSPAPLPLLHGRIMRRRTHHASPRRLPSRNGRPTRAPPSSMAGHPQTSPTASPRRLPFLLRPIKGPHDPLHLSHRSSSLPRPRSAAARGGRAGAPPLTADLLRRHLSHLFKPLGEFLAPSSSFWCNPRRV
jgi:hypothetical protein